MSDTDSFIEEVTEEVRRDKLFATFRKYGWIVVLAVLLIVGGAAWREWQKAQALSQAQGFGDAVLEALNSDEGPARIAALQDIAAPSDNAQAILDLMVAAEQAATGEQAAAAATLQAVSTRQDVPEIYREIAGFKALLMPENGVSAQDRKIALEALAVPGRPLRLLAEEQLALMDLETGDSAAAIDRLNRIIEDAEVTAGLRQRASQLIVALGETPENG